jgi:hypothetical protein
MRQQTCRVVLCVRSSEMRCEALLIGDELRGGSDRELPGETSSDVSDVSRIAAYDASVQ